LAELDRSIFSLAASQAADDAASAAANARASAVDRYSTRLSVDEAALQRAQSLFSAGVSPRKDIDAARAQLAQDQADATVARDQRSSSRSASASAEMRANLANRDLQNTVLRAPSSGVVTAILRRVGENVDSNVDVITLADTEPSQVSLGVAGADLRRVRVGSDVTFRVLGSELSGNGTVEGVSTGIDPVTQTGTVLVRGVPTDAPVGSTVEAKIVVARVRGIVVPESAVVQDPQSGNAVVFVVAKDKNGDESFQQSIVRVVSHNGREVLVSSGLRIGQRIATRGGFTLLAPTDSGGD
jgi:multidrug resistance efflux pump